MGREALMLERSFADSLAKESLNTLAFARWLNCRSSHRFMAYYSKELLVFTLIDNKPVDVVTHSCQSLSVNLEDGFRSEWETSKGGIYYVTHEPREVRDSCFIWHPFSSCVQYPEYHAKRNVRFSACYKTAANPQTRQEGRNYILERAVFEDTFKGM